MAKWVFVAVLTTSALLSCSAPNSHPDSTSPSNEQTRNSAPEFQLENIAGGTLKSADLKGKVSVIDIWATWCEPCIREIPRFNRLHDEYKNQNVGIVGITVLSPHDEIGRKVDELGMKYTVVVGNDAVVDGFGGVLGWPTTFVVSKDWKVYKKYTGALPDKEERIRRDIAKLMVQSE